MQEGLGTPHIKEKGSPTTNSRSAGKCRKCVKCGEKKSLTAFPFHGAAGGERGSYCKECKNNLAKDRRLKDATARLRHYIVTRIKNEMPEKCPKDLHTNLEYYLGYKLFQLKKHLRTELKEREGISLIKSFKLGYHMDHRKPHKSFNIQEIGDAQFKDCWAIENLWMIDATINLRKGAKEDFF